MTGTTLDWKKYCKAKLCAYCEVHEEYKPTNTIYDARTRSAIFIVLTANLQGIYTFLCLKTGNRITRKKFSVVPMTASVVEQVEELATTDVQFEEGITFEDRNNISIEDANGTNGAAASKGV